MNERNREQMSAENRLNFSMVGNKDALSGMGGYDGLVIVMLSWCTHIFLNEFCGFGRRSFNMDDKR